MDATFRQSIQFHRHYHQQLMNGVRAGSIRDCDQRSCKAAVKRWRKSKHSVTRLLKTLLESWDAFRDNDLRQVIINPDGHTAVIGYSYRRTLKLIEAAEEARWLNKVRQFKEEVGEYTAEPGRPTANLPVL